MNRSSAAQILEQILGFLKDDGPLLLSSEARSAFAERAAELLEKANVPGEVLYVGILGGTGVGKSTLINALARDEISHVSDRRPFTDKAVVYRHADTPRGLEEIAALVREPDALHDSDAIRDLVLLDLPDFDSVEQDNRRTVLAILPVLDAVVWVVSPEKYADAAFYEFARVAAINPENFSFVLNKADELITNDGPDPHLRLKEVLGDLTFRLKNQTGLDQPRVFSLSAAYEFQGKTGHPALENEFRRFRDFLLVRRDAKEIASVKTANLVQQIDLLVQEVNEAVQPEDKARIVATIRKIEDEAEEPDGGADLVMVEQRQKLAAALLPVLAAEDQSIGPVKSAMRLLGFTRSAGPPHTPRSLEQTLHETGDILARHWSADISKVTGRGDSEVLLSFQLPDPGMSGKRAEDRMNEALSHALAAFSVNLTRIRESLRGTLSRWRRGVQKLVLWLPVAILIFRLMGERAVNAFLDQPGFINGLKLGLTFLTSIFSSDGLIGLVALLICELLLIWYLAAARIRRIERLSRNLAQSGIDRLDKALQSAALRTRSERKEMLVSIERALDRLLALNAAVHPRSPGGPLKQSVESRYRS